MDKQLIIIGGAIVDVVANVESVPGAGGDALVHQQEIQVGGCAFNIARILAKLSQSFIPVIPIGNGQWAKIIEQEMLKHNINTICHNSQIDNGWCLALVDAHGERTFISFEGCESIYEPDLLASIEFNRSAIVYANGYELLSRNGATLREWLLRIPADITRFVDFGPRISELDQLWWQQLIQLNCIISLNEDEVQILFAGNSINLLMEINALTREYPNLKIIYRVGAKGAYYCHHGISQHIPAFKVPLVDSIGAGDSHAAGVLLKLSSGVDLAAAVKYGNAVAAYTIAEKGVSTPPTQTDIDQIMNGVV